jgi:hypothetical protein
MIKLNKSMFTWDSVEFIPPEDLIKTREQLHHAVQLIAAAGKYLIPERPDDSHTTLHWNEKEEAFEGESINGNQPIKVGYRPIDFTIYLRKREDDITTNFDLKNKTIDQGFTWMKDQLKISGVDISNLNLKLHYDIPSRAFSNEQPFKISNPDQVKNISHYYANANSLLQAISKVLPDTGEIRCWPHHFDIATLYTIDKNKSAEEARAIGIGFAPGDESYEEPYLYLTLWPYPDIQDNTLPDISAGKWHTKGWVGAVLEASDIYLQNDQTQPVIDFMNSAIPACAGLLNHHLEK